MTTTASALARPDALAAIALFDQLGREAFLDRFGYGHARRWFIRHRGRHYDAKAIAGAALGLKASELLGGAKDSNRHLERCGFGVVALEEPDACFASGSNRPADIRSLELAGAAIGVNALERSANALEELKRTTVPVFVDSGAFSEVDHKLRVVAPILPETWRRILGTYLELGRALGSRLSVVAPDRVGDQVHTLDLLEEHKDDLRRLDELGVRVLVPMQRGMASQAGFFRVVREALRGIRWVPAIPGKKSATTAAELEVFAANVDFDDIHILGVGPRSRAYPELLAAIRRHAPRAMVTIDSAWIPAHVGRGGKRPRLLTACRDALAPLCVSGGALDGWIVLTAALVLALALAPNAAILGL